MIVLIAGTRPELIKLFPVALELRERHLDFRVLFTGQHTTLATTVNFLDTFHDHVTSLHLAADGDPDAYVARATQLLRPEIGQADWVVVQGDTSSALAGARAANAESRSLAHVEAGLRSHDLTDPWPEEGYRVAISKLANLHFAPTLLATANLRHEGHTNILVTGNTVVDMLRLHHIQPQKERSGLLVTLHRRESAGEPMRQILQGLRLFATLHPSIPITLLNHPNGLCAAVNPGFPLTPPMPYLDFVTLLAASQAVLTDSGGLVEEATTLTVPTIIARDHTERMEAVLNGSASLAGRSLPSIATSLEHALAHPPTPNPRTFGSGYASTAIVDALIGLNPDFTSRSTDAV